MGLFVAKKTMVCFALVGLSTAALATMPAGGKIPVSTKSDEARIEYERGRDLTERLQLHDAIAHFDKAIALDPSFAVAELGRANVSTTAGEFFDHLKKAVSLSSGASEGERLMILAGEAGVNGDATKQRELLEKLVTEFPSDERGQNLLGTYFFGIQDYEKAIEHLKAATYLVATFAPAYNLLGYSYRSLGNYADAEKTFERYTQLIPGDPNPYDSYAELLMKEGKFDKSITTYKAALSKDANFISAKQGIAFNHLYAGSPDVAESVLQMMLTTARDDGERRQALFDLAVLHIDGGDITSALKDIDNEFAVAEKRKDFASMSADLDAKGIILEQAGNYDAAKALYDQELHIVEASDLSPEVKEGFSLGHLFHETTLALATKNLNGAAVFASQYAKQVTARRNPFRTKLAHELNGSVALEAKEYKKAIDELQLANLQNPFNLYRLALAYKGKGDESTAKEYFAKVANFNSLPNLNYAFVRRKAGEMLLAKNN